METSNAPVCKVIRPSATYDGKQGLSYFSGISAESAAAQSLCMMLLTIPPGARATAHKHENHETAIYMLSGQTEMWYGEELREYLMVREGEFLYIPKGVPHVPVNPDPARPALALIARTDPNEQESVVLLPDLDRALEEREGVGAVDSGQGS
jgi:uncharacterized RmlC-like cupin family protein